MKKFRAALASILSLALLHFSVAPAAAVTLETLGGGESQILAPQSVVPALGANAIPEGAKGGSLPLAVNPIVQSEVNMAETLGAAAQQQQQGAKPEATVTLNAMSGEVLQAQSKGGEPTQTNDAVARYVDGSLIQKAGGGAGFVTGTFSASENRLAPTRETSSPRSSSISRSSFNRQAGKVNTALLVVIGVVAAIAIAIGAIWHHSNQKNEAWNSSKSNQAIVEIEKARRANDGETLYRIGTESRDRQKRMDERIADAKSRGGKKVDDKTGDSLKDAEFYSAADGLAGARAEMNHNAVSQDAAKRIGERTPADWKKTLTEEENYAKATKYEGNLAKVLAAMRAELGREDARDQGLRGDVARFGQQVPGMFKGRLGDMQKKGDADVKEFESTEVQPEHAMYDQFNGAMRERVSQKLAAGSAEYQKHLAHLQQLSDANEQLKPAIELSQQVDRDLKEMLDHEHNRAFNLMLAAQNENVLVEDRDQNGNITGHHYEDHSGTYKALAASEGAAARASASSAQAGVKALHAILPLLRKNKTLQDEGLASLIPQDPRTNIQSNGSVFFDFWIPATWNLFGTMFTESQAGQARAAFAPILAQLQGAQQLVGERQGQENGWVNQAIDQDLNRQIKQGPPK